MTLGSRAWAAVDYFVPPSLQCDPLRARRARLLVAFCLAVFAISMLVQGIRLQLQEQHWLPLTGWAVCTMLVFITPFALRATGKLSLVAVLPGLGVMIGIAAIAAMEGGLESPNASLLPGVPIAFMLIAGRRTGAIMAALVAVTFALFAILPSFGVHSPPTPLSDEGLTLMRAAVGTVFALTLVIVGAIYERQQQDAHRKLETKAEELAHARDLALEAAHAKSQFLANMSHEIRTPLNGVLGMTELLLHAKLGPEQLEHVRTIHRSGGSLLTVINDILDFSALEAGKVSIVNAPMDVQTCLDECAAVFTVAAKERDIALTMELDADCPERVTADASRIRQVLINLVGNALKFTHAGEVCVRVDRPKEGRLRFRVRDTGIGIPAENQAKLFEAFTQADDSMTRKYGGTGLGLAISQQLVQRMGGSMELESAPGKGSTFSFSVAATATEAATPMLSMPPGPRPSQPQAAAAFEPDFGVRHPLKVLIAEDNFVNQEVIGAMVEGFGLKADIAGDGLQALEAMATKHYDLVLLDMNMPELGGHETAKQVRAQPELYGRPRLVAFTASVLPEEQRSYIGVGIDGFMPKPVSIETLHTELTRTAEGTAQT